MKVEKSDDEPFNKAASTKRIKSLVWLGQVNRVQIGRGLIKAKKALGHGEFRAWASNEFSFSKNTVSNLMNLARAADEVGDDAASALPAKIAYSSHKSASKIPAVGILKSETAAFLAPAQSANKLVHETENDRWLYAFDAAEILVDTLGSEVMSGTFSQMTKLEWFLELLEGAGPRKFEVALKKLTSKDAKEAA
ncbi:MAG: DUF3102 domain-containing protein [Proteobacteria bacterium]|nr:DUF3102 domain-containing protein [Pseudomonadota bacterium]